MGGVTKAHFIYLVYTVMAFTYLKYSFTVKLTDEVWWSSMLWRVFFAKDTSYGT